MPIADEVHPNPEVARSSVLRHTVLLTLTESTSTATRDDLLNTARAFLVSQEHGSDWTCLADAGLVAGNAAMSLTVDFATVDDFRAFQDDPEHLAVLTVLRPHVSGRAAVQSWVVDEV